MVTKQNITDKLYETGLINNTDLQVSNHLTALVFDIMSLDYNDVSNVSTDISNGTLTPDTYIYYNIRPAIKVIDTAARIVELY